MIYLPDTNLCVSYLRNKNANVTKRFQTVSAADIMLCDIVKAELWYGAYRSGRFSANQQLLNAFFAPFVSLAFDGAAAEIYGRVRRELEMTGMPVGPHDLLIASIALANNLIVVTHNTREFVRISGLRIEDWET